jgi:MFS family permease
MDSCCTGFITNLLAATLNVVHVSGAGHLLVLEQMRIEGSAEQERNDPQLKYSLSTGAFIPTDPVEIRTVYSLAAFGVGLPLALCSLVSEPWQLYLLYGLLGVGTGIFGPSIYTVIMRWFTEKRGLALGFATSCAGFGALAVAPLTNTLIASYGWRNTFVILGLASVIILFVCAQFIKNPPEPASDKTGSVAGKSADRDQERRPNTLHEMTFGQAIRTREIMFIIAGSAAAQITSRVIAVHIAPHAIDIGISPFVASMTHTPLSGVCSGATSKGGSWSPTSVIPKPASRTTLIS